VEIYLPLAGMIDLAAERARLEKELGQVEAQIGRSQKVLDSAGFVAKAPPEVVQKERDKLAGLQDQAEKLKQRLAMVR
jgi:valyl-tRNA synthetase